MLERAPVVKAAPAVTLNYMASFDAKGTALVGGAVAEAAKLREVTLFLGPPGAQCWLHRKRHAGDNRQDALEVSGAP